jgi:hypothetical protein
MGTITTTTTDARPQRLVRLPASTALARSPGRRLDVIAALVAAYAEAGAAEVIVWEPDAAERPSQAEAAHAAIARRAALAGAPITLMGGADIAGYARAVGRRVFVVSAEAARDAEAWRSAVAGAGARDVVVTDGPVPADAPPDVLLSLSSVDSMT